MEKIMHLFWVGLHVFHLFFAWGHSHIAVSSLGADLSRNQQRLEIWRLQHTFLCVSAILAKIHSYSGMDSKTLLVNSVLYLRLYSLINPNTG